MKKRITIGKLVRSATMTGQIENRKIPQIVICEFKYFERALARNKLTRQCIQIKNLNEKSWYGMVSHRITKFFHYGQARVVYISM